MSKSRITQISQSSLIVWLSSVLSGVRQCRICESTGTQTPVELTSRSDTTLLPNQTCRHLLDVSRSTTSDLDLRQQGVVDNLGRLVDNQPESITSSAHPDIQTTLDPALLDTYSSSRNRFRLETLSEQFPPISSDISRSIFPLVDPTDLDLIVSWRIPDSERVGQTFAHGIRVSPEFSAVENLRRKIEKAILSGGKQTRTMYEETGRLRKLLLDSVLDGALAKEDDPLVVRGFVNEANAGVAKFDLEQGYVTSSPKAVRPVLTLSPCLVPTTIEIHNLSPLLATRYILRLPPSFTPSATRETYTPARHVGTLEHRGTLQSGETASITTSFWISEPALVELEWELVVETGEEVEGIWTVRKTWTRKEQGGVWKIEQSSST